MDTPGVSTNTLNWDQRNLIAIEQIHPNVTRSWLADGRIVCFTIDSATRLAIDAWLASSEEVTKIWPAALPYLCIHDVRGVGVTPYMRQQSAATVARTPKYLKGRSAVIVPRSFANQLIRLVVTIDLARLNRNIQRSIFFSREAATKWLLEDHRKS